MRIENVIIAKTRKLCYIFHGPFRETEVICIYHSFHIFVRVKATILHNLTRLSAFNNWNTQTIISDSLNCNALLRF